MRRTRKRSTRQKGGAVQYLDPAVFGYRSGADLQRDMDMFTIAAHGQVTHSHQFIVVPPNTYFIFTSHSSDPAFANDPAAESYLLRGRDESEEQYYNRMYTNLFKPHSQRSGPRLSKTLYIYEPGDLVPNYDLFFHNTSMFLFTHGVYRLPMERRFDTEENGTYLGHTKPYIKKLVNHRDLSISDIANLKKENKDYILSTKPSRHSALRQRIDKLIMYTPKYIKSALYEKIEEICCHTYPGNLLYSEPLQTEFRIQLNNPKPVIQLADLLPKIQYDTTKSKRLFFMHYCRVDYKHYSDAKPLMRTASFAGKCPLTKPNDRAFNTFRVAEAICNLPVEIKQELVANPDGRRLIRILKSVIPPGVINWLECIGDVYRGLNIASRSQLLQDYSGFIAFNSMEWMAYTIPNLCKRLIRSAETKGLNKEAVLTFSIPFFMLEKELSTQIYTFNRDTANREKLIEKITEYFRSLVKESHSKSFFSNDSKLNNLKTNELEEILTGIESGEYTDRINSFIETIYTKTDEESPTTIVDLIERVFIIYFPEEFSGIIGNYNLPVIRNVARNVYFQNLNQRAVAPAVGRALAGNNNNNSVAGNVRVINNEVNINRELAEPAPAGPRGAWENDDYVLELPAPAPAPNRVLSAWEINDFEIPEPRGGRRTRRNRKRRSA